MGRARWFGVIRSSEKMDVCDMDEVIFGVVFVACFSPEFYKSKVSGRKSKVTIVC